MVRTIFKVLVVDVILLIAEFYVIQDLDWRTGYAASLHQACPRFCSYSPSFSYNLLVRSFTMVGNGVSLTSPPTLDWVQLLAYILIVINVWFGYSILAKRKSSKTAIGSGHPSAPTQ
jgi:hypothetical protein